jgi:aminopeptidase
MVDSKRPSLPPLPPIEEDTPAYASLRLRSASRIPSTRPSAIPRRPSLRPTAPSIPPAALLPTDIDLANAARRIVERSLNVVRGDVVVLLTDRDHRELAHALEQVVASLEATGIVYELGDHEILPLRSVPQNILESLRGAQASVYIAGVETAEQSFRRELVDLVSRYKLRHGHMLGVTRRAMLTGFTVDPVRILDATRALRMRLRPDSRAVVRSRAGTNLTVQFASRYRWVEQTGTIRPGRWENLPAGELATVPERVDGVFVADAALACARVLTNVPLQGTPIQFTIENSLVTNVACSDNNLRSEVENALRDDRHGNRVGTVIFGTNIGISDPTGELVCDQSMPGLHLSFGKTYASETGAEWDSNAQVVAAQAYADIDLDGTALLRAGRYLV